MVSISMVGNNVQMTFIMLILLFSPILIFWMILEKTKLLNEKIILLSPLIIASLLMVIYQNIIEIRISLILVLFFFIFRSTNEGNV